MTNSAPVAGNDSYSVTSGETLTVAAPGLLGNDSDPDGDALSITSLDTAGLRGSLSALINGSFTFTPDSGFAGPTTFTYEMSDGAGGLATGTVSITVNADNHAPVASDDAESDGRGLGSHIRRARPTTRDVENVLADCRGSRRTDARHAGPPNLDGSFTLHPAPPTIQRPRQL